MTKEKLIEELKKLQAEDDIEMEHARADDLLIAYINDNDIAEEYGKVGKWYA